MYAQKKKTTELCKATGIANSTFSTWKKENREPQLKYIPDIARFLGVSTDYLLIGKDGRYIRRENDKVAARAKINNESLPISERYHAKLQEYRALFDRSIEFAEDNGFIDAHPCFNQYVAMMLNQNVEKKRTPAEIYKRLIAEYGTLQGIKEGTSYWLADSSIPDNRIASEEVELIKKYRELDARGKETVEFILDREYNLAAQAANTPQKQPVNDREKELEEFRANWKRDREKQKKSVPAKENTV